MRIKYAFIVAVLPWVFLMCNESYEYEWEDGRWVDLTYEFSDETLYWPTAETFRLDPVFAGQTEAGFYYEAYRFCTAEHGGTHLDAPVHFARGRKSVDQLDLEQLTGRAVVIDVSGRAAVDRDYRIGTEDIREWENSHGVVPDGSILLFRTGFGEYWPDPERYLGTPKRGEEALDELSFPGIHPDAARWLVENRQVKAVGIDTPSLDYGRSTHFESHQIFFAENIPGFENVANLDRLPATDAYVVALPMKISGGSGAPLRIVAHLVE